MMSRKNFLMIMTLFVFLAFDVQSQTSPQINNCGDADKFPKLMCSVKVLNLVDDDNPIKIKIYTKANSSFQPNRTFVVVHYNEQKGLNAVKEVLSEDNYGGRLVEVESNYRKEFKAEFNVKDIGNEKRYLYFGNRKSCVDPNRIYTETGILKALREVGGKRQDGKGNSVSPICAETPSDADTVKKIGKFAKELIDIVTENGKRKFVIGVHNNTEGGSLSVASWLGSGSEAKTAEGIIGSNYHPNSKKLSTDDFILVSNPLLFSLFFDAENPFALSIALQEGKSYLTDSNGKIAERFDDGSMSVYFGTTNFADTNKPYLYVNIEAGGKDNPAADTNPSKKWQKEMIRKAIKISL